LTLTRPAAPGDAGVGRSRSSASVKGCDWIQEVTVSVQRCTPTGTPQERTQRCALLASTNSTAQLLEFGLRCRTRREQLMVRLSWTLIVRE